MGGLLGTQYWYVGGKPLFTFPLGNSWTLGFVSPETGVGGHSLRLSGRQPYHCFFMPCLLNTRLHHPSHGCCSTGGPRRTLPGVVPMARGRGLLQPSPSLGAPQGISLWDPVTTHLPILGWPLPPSLSQSPSVHRRFPWRVFRNPLLALFPGEGRRGRRRWC